MNHNEATKQTENNEQSGKNKSSPKNYFKCKHKIIQFKNIEWLNRFFFKSNDMLPTLVLKTHMD